MGCPGAFLPEIRPFMFVNDICESINEMWVHGRRLRQRADTIRRFETCDVKSWTVNRSVSQWGLNMHQSVPQGAQLCLKCGQMDAKCTQMAQIGQHGLTGWIIAAPMTDAFLASWGHGKGDLVHLPHLRILTILVLGIHNLRAQTLWFISKRS